MARTRGPRNHGLGAPPPGTLHEKVVDVTAIAAIERTGREYEHRVLLRLDESHKWVLSIEDTPGHWYMSTLLLSWPEPDVADFIEIPPRMSIDAGQGWYVKNWREVLTAAIKEI